MTPEEWEAICSFVTDAMLDHTRPFVTPLRTETRSDVRLVGTGSYVQCQQRRVLTCEHVARTQPMHIQFYGSESVYAPCSRWQMDRHPADAAFASVCDELWGQIQHKAAVVPYARFADRHESCEGEILFFRGFAGENSRYGFGVHETDGTGYGTQEKRGSGDDQIFELLWEPENTQFTASATPEVQKRIGVEDAHGFSGSLVWNTRYVELNSQGLEWSPQGAVVTGLLRRWDEGTRTLLAWRVEHLRSWLDSKNA